MAKLAKSKTPPTLQFDEPGHVQGKKQCDILIRYWSYRSGLVVSRFLEAVMFGQAKSKDVRQALLDTPSETRYAIPLPQLIFVGSDGLTVNRASYLDIC